MASLCTSQCDARVTGLFTFLSTSLVGKRKCLFAARVTAGFASLRINWKN
jgi:hypothetical protein